MRYLRTSLRVAGILSAVVVVVLVVVVLVSQTAWFRDWLRRYAMREAAQFVDGQLLIGRLDGGLWGGVQLHDVRIDRGGDTVVGLDTLELEYRLFDFIREGVVVRRVELVAPRVALRREGDTWNVATLLVDQGPSDPDAPRATFRVGSIVLRDGLVTVNDPTCPAGTAGCLPERIEQLQADLGLTSTPEALDVDLRDASFRTSEPALALLRLRTTVRMTDTDLAVSDLDLATAASVLSGEASVKAYATSPDVAASLRAEPLALAEVGRFVPQLGATTLMPVIAIDVEGPLRALRVTTDVKSDAGALSTSLVADGEAPAYGARGSASVTDFDLAGWMGDPALQTAITARTDLDVTGSDLQTLAGNVALEATSAEAMGYRVGAARARAEIAEGVADVTGDVQAYGATVTTAGTVDFAGAAEGDLALALAGDIRDLDVRQLPATLGAPPLRTDISLAYRAEGPLDRMRVRADFRPSTVDTLTIDGGTTADVTIAGSDISYAVTGGVRNVNLQRIGQVFDVAALDAPAYESDITARIDARGRGIDVASAVADVSLHVTDSSLGGARVPDLRLEASANRGAVEARLNGRVDDLRPEVFAGRDDVAGRVSGTIDASVSLPDVTGTIDPALVTGQVALALDPSDVGGVRLDELRADVTADAGQVEVRQLQLTSAAATLEASGPFALVDAGNSRLTYALDVRDAGTLAALAGVSGVAGTAQVEGVLSGWLQDLSTTGTLAVADAVYSETASVERLDGTFTAAVPALDVARASAAVDLDATRLDAGGTLVDTAAVEARYADSQADFEADVTLNELAAGAGGVLALEEARQVVTLRRLEATGDGLAWALAPGASPQVTHEAGRVAIDDLRLASGTQRLDVQGAVRLPSDAAPFAGEGLEVQVTAVDLAPIGARLMPERELAGTLDATIGMNGALHDGVANVDVQVRQGAVQGFTFDALEATAQYADGVAAVKTTLQQSAASALTAEGRVPVLAAIGSAPEGHPVDERLDLTVVSNGIDLAVVEGVTDYVADVQGRLLVDATVTGTLAQPDVDGMVTIRDGAFRVPLVDARYTGLQAEVHVGQDQVRVDTLRLLDTRENPFEVSGTLGLVDTTLGDVDLRASASEFRLIDNDLGDVRLTADVTVAGTPSAPIVRGELSLPSSRIDVDRLLAALAGAESDVERNDVDLVFEPHAASSAGPDSPADATTPPGAPNDGVVVVQRRDVSAEDVQTVDGDVVEAGQAAEAVDAAEPAEGDAPASGVLDAATIDVRFTVADDLVLRGDDVRVGDGGPSLGALNMTVGADLRATQSPGEPLLVTGQISTVRGYYDFQGRRFTVVRDGAIRFQGDDVTNPTLDIAATRDISGVEARIDVEGTANEPQLRLSSTPSLDEADILALIVFNRPLDDLGSGEQVSLAQRAGELVGGRLTGALATTLRDALDVDQFEIDAFAETGPAVTVGNRLGERIYVRLRQQLGSQDVSQILLEYELLRNLRLQTSMTQGGNTDRSPGQRVERSGIDLLYFFYY